MSALAAFCDEHPDDGAQAGAVNCLRPITGGRAIYDGADGAGVLDVLSD
jgi:shikimate 5-dehydrogenase